MLAYIQHQINLYIP